MPLLVIPTWLAFRTGGYTTGGAARSLALTAAASFALLGFVAVVGPWPPIARGRPVVALATLCAFAAWILLSISWARLLTDAGNDGVRAAMYCAVFALALAVTRSRAVRRAAPVVLLAGITVVALYALGSRLTPGLVPTDTIYLAGDRLAQPLTYWNALGILMVSGVLLSIAVAAGGAWPRAVRATACAAAVPCGLALVLSLSRGSLVALVVGLVVLGLVWPRPATALAAGLGLSAATLCGSLALALPAVRSLERSQSAQEAQGAVVSVVAVAAAIGVGLLFARLLPRADGPPWQIPRRLRVGIALGLVAAIVVGGLLAVRYVERTKDVPTSAGRVITLESNRASYWGVALDAFADHPVAGVGTGSFAAEWRRERDEPQNAFDAHSLYIETLAELGLVGALLLAAFVASIAAGVVARVRAVPDDPLLPAAAGVLAALAIHVGLDWDWEMPAVTIPALILAAAALQPREADLD